MIQGVDNERKNGHTEIERREQRKVLDITKPNYVLSNEAERESSQKRK